MKIILSILVVTSFLLGQYFAVSGTILKANGDTLFVDLPCQLVVGDTLTFNFEQEPKVKQDSIMTTWPE